MNKPLKTCPVCSGNLIVSQLSCKKCGIDISGDFEMPGEQWNLSQELLDFIKVFLYAEGSIKQSEKLLNCSYPKIKNLLKKTKLALGIADQNENEEESVIGQLENGEIDVEEALRLLKTTR